MRSLLSLDSSSQSSSPQSQSSYCQSPNPILTKQFSMRSLLKAQALCQTSGQRYERTGSRSLASSDQNPSAHQRQYQMMGRQSSSFTLVIIFSFVVMMSLRITLMQLRRSSRCSMCYSSPRRLSCLCSSRSPSDFSKAAETNFMRQLQQDLSLVCCYSQWVSIKVFCSFTDLSFCQPTDLSFDILPIKFYIQVALLPFSSFGLGFGYSFSTAKPWLASWIAHFQQYMNTSCSSLMTKNFAALSE